MSFDRGARVIQVIETDLTMYGNGVDSVLRSVKQYWTLDGKLLAVVDPFPEECVSTFLPEH